MITIKMQDALDGLKSIATDSADLIVTDPPYFLLNESWDNQWKNKNEYFIWLETIFSEFKRILKTTGSCYVFQCWQHLVDTSKLLENYVPNIRNIICWERNKGRSSSNNYKSISEFILYNTMSKEFTFNEQKMLRDVVAPYKDTMGKPKGWHIDDETGRRVRWTGIGNVWHYTPPFWKSKENLMHPTQKPLEMIKRIVESSSDENNLVVDPFLGSGTTAEACKLTNRNFIGFESNEKFYEMSLKRIKSKMDGFFK